MTEVRTHVSRGASEGSLSHRQILLGESAAAVGEAKGEDEK